uniref:BPTI/Kunitz inhibitor domain-containing protein n=1 Tax=Panagrolaimus sp. ES5 TaxID=591445 RepID=A0AC34F296_9BILA
MGFGEGNAALTRFYYDAEKRQCLPFNYLGTKGNTNNFLTKEFCEELCPVWVNPCAKGEPLLGQNSKPIQCHQRQPCQMGYYCHIGYDDETTVCCPSQNVDACTVSMSQGFGPHVMSRWFYDSAQRQCKQFTYKGLRGNENNFLLRDHCEQTCPVWDNPCPAGEPILGGDNKPKQCFPGQESSCPGTHWCHPGLNLASTVCCPGRQDPCVLAVSAGAGTGNQQRWYFDMAVKQCKSFVYKGIKGNANNFATKDDCEQRCPVFVDPCPLTYAYAGVSSLPVQYVKCSPENQQCPQSFWCHLGQSPETTVCCPNAVKPCTLPSKVQGSGELRLTRWSYDANSQACQPFEYFGIKGNQNNFLTREACESSCPSFENPCKSGDPFMVAGKPQFCKRETPCPG